VKGENFRFELPDLGEILFNGFGNLQVVATTTRFHEGLVGRFLDEGVGKEIPRLGQLFLMGEKAGFHQLIEAVSKDGILHQENLAHQVLAETSADDGGDLCHLLDGRKLVQSRHERVL